jgi:glycosyl transferase family 25
MTKVPVFLVNRRSDRLKRETMLRRCGELGIVPRLIEGVEGKEVVQQIPHTGVSPGELGCLLSHRTIYETILREQIPWSLVLEDDVRFDPELPAILGATERLPADCTVLLLGHHSCNARILPTARHFRRSLTLTQRFRVVRPAENACGTYGYLIALEGARRLLAETERIEKPADHYTGDHTYCGLRILHPPVVLIDETLDRHSAIGAERNAGRTVHHTRKERLLKFTFIRYLYRIRHGIRSLLRGWGPHPCDKGNDV